MAKKMMRLKVQDADGRVSTASVPYRPLSGMTLSDVESAVRNAKNVKVTETARVVRMDDGSAVKMNMAEFKAGGFTDADILPIGGRLSGTNESEPIDVAARYAAAWGIAPEAAPPAPPAPRKPRKPRKDATAPEAAPVS